MTTEPERRHWSPMLLGALFGCSALAIVVILGALLWADSGRGTGSPIGAQPPGPAYSTDGSLPAGSPSAATRSVPAPVPPGVASAATATSATPTTTARTGGTGSTGNGSPTPAPGGSATLRAGDRGPEVTALQRLLFDQGFTYVATTGVFDTATSRGVTQLQHDRGLTCDAPGVYGPCTRAALTR